VVKRTPCAEGSGARRNAEYSDSDARARRRP